MEITTKDNLPLQSSYLMVTKTSDHTLVITPNCIGSHPPYPSKDDGGHDTIRVLLLDRHQTSKLFNTPPYS
jgi:hypothetical protein